MNRRHASALILAILLAGCAESPAKQLSADTVQITVEGDKNCGAREMQTAAMNAAAIETLRHGYDAFIVADTKVETLSRVAGSMSGTANRSGTDASQNIIGHGTAVASAPTTLEDRQAIYDTTYDQKLVVKMFHANDAGSEKALPARDLLGPEWEKFVAKGSVAGTCDSHTR